MVDDGGRKGQMIPQYYVWAIVYQLASALCYCHEGKRVADLQEPAVVPRTQDWKVVLHRDIKPKNGRYVSKECERRC